MGANRFNSSQRQFSKRNYIETVSLITPGLYSQEDINLSGEGLDPTAEVINSHLNIANNFSSILFVSSLPDTIHSGISNLEGISPYFIKQNNLTNITPNIFEKKILLPLNRSFRNFSTTEEFASYVSGTLLSSIVLNHPTASFEGITQGSATHAYLVENLSWLYFLNTSADGGLNYQPSSYVFSSLVYDLFKGRDFTLNEGIKGLTEFIWRNYETCSTWKSLSLIPNQFSTSSFVAQTQYTSGLQQLEKLQTLVDVVYSPLYMDAQDTKVKEAFEVFLEQQKFLTDPTILGPFTSLLRAFSFSFADTANAVNILDVLYNIEECPDEYLPFLADLIGWRLFGSDASRWRLQLVNAVDIYKRAGTKASIKLAVDSIFAQDVFDVTSNITELWESYIPFLIYYALATESSAFIDFTTWTRELAEKLDVDTYSTSSMDDNLRIATDNIILSVVSAFPDKFRVANKPFPIGSSSFIFNFRGRDFPIPPWEEIPYYANADLSEQMIRLIVDKLVCFGVRKEFAFIVGNYIRDNTLRALDDIRDGNSWLIFTSSMQVPSNWNDIVTRVYETREEFLALWSGKSSHYKLIFEASSFDFAKDTLEVDSSLAPVLASRVANEFSPAHSIQDTILKLGEEDEYDISGYSKNFINFDFTDIPISVASSLSRMGFSGVDMTSFTGFQRNQADEIGDSIFSSSAAVIVPRNAFRRRNFKYSLPTNGYYDRTGFNMPISWDVSTLEHSMPSSLGFLPLGYIPSALRYMDITDYKNIPDVYSICEDLDSENSYSGVDVSNTFPCRGRREYTVSDSYVDRCQLDPFIWTSFRLKEDSKPLFWEATLSSTNYEIKNQFWKNVYGSLANSATEGYTTSSISFLEIDGADFEDTLLITESGDSLRIFESLETTDNQFPQSVEDYWNIEFGRDFHLFYKDYTDIFQRHGLRPDILDLDGPTIFANAFGSIFRNSKLDKKGYIAEANPGFCASSLSGAVELNNNKTVFSLSDAVNYNTTAIFEQSSLPVYVLDETGNLINSIALQGGEFSEEDILLLETGLGLESEETILEWRNAHILSGVELVQTYGGSPFNSFTVYNLDESQRNTSQKNYLIDNPFIRMKAVNGLPRVRYTLKTYVNPTSEGYQVTSNYFIPEHDISVTLKLLGADEQGLTTGGLMVGAWIHTDYEGGNTWSYTPQKEWIQTPASQLTKTNVFSKLSHFFNLPLKNRKKDTKDDDRLNKGICVDFGSEIGGSNILLSFEEEDFQNLRIDFHTKNKRQKLTPSYHKQFGNLHRLTQNYILEIFLVPDIVNRDKFLLLDEINVIDETNNRRRKYPVYEEESRTPFSHCNQVLLDTTKEDVKEIFKFFNGIAGGLTSRIPYASRIASQTESLYDTSGGSRLNYRIHPNWTGSVSGVSDFYTELVI